MRRTSQKRKTIIFGLFIQSLFMGSLGWGWGGRGHSSICEAAVFLLQEEGLRNFLKARPHVMGHLCNIPDIQWRQLPLEQTKIGNPTHYFSPDLIGLKIQDVPNDYEKLNKIIAQKKIELSNKNPSQLSPHQTLREGIGSAWWRIQQFFNRATSIKEEIQKAPPPNDKTEEQLETLAYNQKIYHFMINLGIMGHFVADLSQPYHNTADYDGWEIGHGGIHKFYEETCVSEMDGNLISKIISSAQKIKGDSFIKPDSIVEKMKALSILSANDIGNLLKLDSLLEKSRIIQSAEGGPLKVQAKRKAPKEICSQFNKLILTHLGRGAQALAHLWDQAYLKINKPDLTKYKSYKYPLTVEFVPPDYDSSSN